MSAQTVLFLADGVYLGERQLEKKKEAERKREIEKEEGTRGKTEKC